MEPDNILSDEDKRRKRAEELSDLLNRMKNICTISPVGNLTLNEISSLVTISDASNSKGSDLTMSEAGELLNLCRSAMSQLVSRLERKGMLKREVVLWDRRKTTVKLTKKAKNLVDKLASDRLGAIEIAIDMLGDDHIDQFIALFKEYINAVENGKYCE